MLRSAPLIEHEEAKGYLLVSPLYIFAVVTLLLNDFVLKRCWPGFVTGKLSDFAGLFAFGVFLLVVTRTGFALIALALCFAFWKSPFADGLIQVCSAATGFAIGRTVDPTDLTALTVLPFALFVYRVAEPGNIRRSWCCILSCLVSVFAFTATSRGPTPQEQAAFHASVAEFEFFADEPSYSFSVDRRSLYRALESWGFRVSGSTAIFPNPGKHSAYLIPPRSRSLRDRTGKPELFGAEFDVDDSGRGVTVRVTKLSIRRAGHSVSRADAVRIFESRVISPLRQRGASLSPLRHESRVATTSNQAMQRTQHFIAYFFAASHFSKCWVADLVPH